MEIEVSMTGGQAERFDQMVTKFGSNPTRFLPVHVEVDKEYNVEVFDLSRKCDGIAKVKGFVVFVKGSGVGEKVKIKITNLGPRFALASTVGPADKVPLVRVIKPYSSIVEPVE